MKKIDGEIIQQAVEVGAKYIADDGKEFDSKWDCQIYEAKIKTEERNKKFLKVYDSIMESKLIEGNNSTDERIYIKRFETKEEFLNIYNALEKYYYGGTDYYAYYDNYKFLKEEYLPEFPANFVIKFKHSEYSDSPDLETFHFIEVNKYIKTLQDKIDVVKEAIK